MGEHPMAGTSEAPANDWVQLDIYGNYYHAIYTIVCAEVHLSS